MNTNSNEDTAVPSGEAHPAMEWQAIERDGRYYVSDGQYIRAQCNQREDAELIVTAFNAYNPAERAAFSPWKANQDPSDGGRWVVSPRIPEGHPICSVFLHEGDEFHARLIAAAPALCAALKEILNYGVEFDDQRLPYVVAHVDKDAVVDAYAALALAKPLVSKETK